MEKCRVKVKYPHIRIEIEGCELKLESWEGEVQSLADLRRIFSEGPYSLFEALLHILTRGDLKAEITFEGKKGGKMQVPFKMDGYEWLNVPTISDQSIRAALGDEISIRYMGRLHKTLYATSIKNRARIGQPRTLATLRTLGLIEQLQITDKGTVILKQLQELGPPQNTAGLVMIANELLSCWEKKCEDNPLCEWLLHELLIMPDFKFTAGKYRITDKGLGWLASHSRQLISLKSFARRTEMIRFLPAEALNEFLSSPDVTIRAAAQKRMKGLQL